MPIAPWIKSIGGEENMTQSLEYELWLHGLSEIPLKLKVELYNHFSSIKEVHKANEEKLKKLNFLSEEQIAIILKGQKEESFRRVYEKLEEEGIRFIPWNAPEYPPSLLEMPDYPHGIFVKGNLPKVERLSIGIVGARKCTSYGEHYALEYSKALAQVGVQIISGLARGIDGCGHRGALLVNEPTFAVLGSGVDVCYPKENTGLYQDILTKGGGILSEFIPGTMPLAFHFPMRNRIIGGLSKVLLVIEAKEKSGSLITADIALEQGKDIYALPGSVDSSYSKGCHYLIKQGAGILISPEELIKDLDYLIHKTKKNNPYKKGECESFNNNNKIVLDKLQDMVYSLMCFTPKSINQLVEETQLAIDRVWDALVSLELKGLIKEVSKNYYVRL